MDKSTRFLIVELAVVIALIVLLIIWMVFLLTYQNKLIALSEPEQDRNLPARFTTVFHQWYFWGAAATVLPLISLVLMLLKPALR